MQTRRRLTCVITARPSYARVQTLLEALRPQCALSVVCVASALLHRYGSVVDQIRADGFDVTATIHSLVDGDAHAAAARTMALTTLDLSTLFAHTRPDAVLTVADRYETLATAVAAAYQHIPLIHVQGGETTGSIDDKVRHAVSQLADLHLVSHRSAESRLLEARVPGRVVVTGCPSLDLAARVDDTPLTTLPGTGAPVNLAAPFVLALFHPVTSEAADAGNDTMVLQAALDGLSLPVVWFWPNVDSGSERVAKALRTWTPTNPTHFVRQVPPKDFVRLMRQCAVMVGNSSAGIREGSFLGTPVVDLGGRQAGRLHGPNVVHAPITSTAIRRAMRDRFSWTRQPSLFYGDGHAGPRAAQAVLAWLEGPP